MFVFVSLSIFVAGQVLLLIAVFRFACMLNACNAKISDLEDRLTAGQSQTLHDTRQLASFFDVLFSMGRRGDKAEARLQNLENRTTSHFKLLTTAVNDLRRAELAQRVLANWESQKKAAQRRAAATAPDQFEIQSPDLRSQADTQGTPHAI